MIELVVLADDATGALDTGVQFAPRTICYVAFSPDADVPPDARVLVIDTRSRHDAPEAAARKIREAIARYPGARYYKKTDSVLRGNIGAEIAALHSATEAPVCFVPFYPAQGRSTVGGVQILHGVRVDQTGFATDPENPVREAAIVKLLEVAGLRARVVAPPYRLPDPMPDVLVFDGDSDEHLRNIARVLAQRKLEGVTAGCAGFAAHLSVSAMEIPQGAPIRRPLLIASGSASAATLVQIECAKERGIAVFTPTAEQWLGDESLDILTANCASELSAGRSVILASAVQNVPLLPPNALPKGVLQRRLAEITEQLLDKTAAPTLMAVGGDYLAAALALLCIGGLRPLREAAPGVALCRAGNLNILTKSGGFGNAELLANIAEGVIR